MEAARDLAHALHKANIKLVYGGGTVGLMGEVARTLVSLSGPDSVRTSTQLLFSKSPPIPLLLTVTL
jgi:predicted Rossmann-fold nucleotide-binding protein